VINGIGTNWGEFGLRLLMAFLLFSKTSNTSSGVVFIYSGKSLCGKNCYLQKKKMGKFLSFEDVYLLLLVEAKR
jgi:hypothetical protein